MRALGATCVTLTAVLATGCSDPLARAPAIDDARACHGSNAELVDAANHFGLAIPEDATDMRFYTDVHPMFGDYTLELRMTLTPEALADFVEDSGFPPVGAHDPGTNLNTCVDVDFAADPVGAERSDRVVEFVVLSESDDRIEVWVAALDL